MRYAQSITLMNELYDILESNQFTDGKYQTISKYLAQICEQKQNYSFILVNTAKNILDAIGIIKENQRKLVAVRKSGAWSVYVQTQGKLVKRGTVSKEFYQAGFDRDAWTVCRNLSYSVKVINQNKHFVKYELIALKGMLYILTKATQEDLALFDMLLQHSFEKKTIEDQTSIDLLVSRNLHKYWGLLGDTALTALFIWKLRHANNRSYT